MVNSSMNTRKIGVFGGVHPQTHLFFGNLVVHTFVDEYKKYNLSSSKHFEEYQRGERGDTQDAVNWVGYYRVYLKKNFVTHFQAPGKQAHCISSFAFGMDHFCGSLGIGGEVSRFWGVSGV